MQLLVKYLDIDVHFHFRVARRLLFDTLVYESQFRSAM
jgi:hypothetical protein